MMNNKKKNKKSLIIGIILVAILLILITVPILTGNRGNIYQEDTVGRGDIETYYAFSGNVESKNTQNIFAEKIIQISDIYVSEGDKVEKDDVIFKTSQGDEIEAKISGTVTKIYIDEDETAMSGTKLCDIVDLDNLEVTLKVDEYDIASITDGKEVEITIGAIDQEITGIVTDVSEIAIVQNGIAYFTASVDLPKNEEVKIGMSAEARILNESVSDALIIPIESLQFDEDEKPFVNIKDENGDIINQAVEVGINDGNMVEIKEGVNEDQTIYYQDTTNTSSNSGGRGMIPPMSGR
ncbi:hemolysin D [Vallitalea longa]|uniref:Hemolysin D n=1 Tax=Vallitalea longa TaxID=2936439 RepID=A0A9W6DEU8_9FIRM|nr:HlyD family efflux transporter periplasmic adaptor subunit [Vallitalea longa]GKX28832.1 hemolysin D [Vallitalea longa]